MKKFTTLILITLLMITPNKVNAIGSTFNENNLNSCVADGKCFLLCGYNAQAVADMGKKKTSVEIYYKYDNSWLVDFDSANTPFNGSSIKNDGDPFYVSEKVAEVLQDGICPGFAYYETNGVNQACITQTANGCNAYDDDFKTTIDKNLQYDHMSKVTAELEPIVNSMSSITCSTILAEENPDTYITNKLKDGIKTKFYNGNDIPVIIQNSKKMQTSVTQASTKYSSRLTECIDEEKAKIDEKVSKGELTEEEAKKLKEELDAKKNSLKNKLGSVQQTFGILRPNIVVNINVSAEGCNLISSDFQEWLQWLLDTIRIAGLVLTVVLGVMDYMKASFASKEDAMKEANKNFSTRLLALALLLLVPTIVNTALIIFNIGVTADNPTCGIN